MHLLPTRMATLKHLFYILQELALLKKKAQDNLFHSVQVNIATIWKPVF